jgi:hypothetical protein
MILKVQRYIMGAYFDIGNSQMCIMGTSLDLGDPKIHNERLILTLGTQLCIM